MTVGVEPNYGQSWERQQEVRSELQAGNITQREAQLNLIEAVTTSFQGRATADFGLTVDDSVFEAGTLLVTGPSAGLVDTLSADSVTGLSPQATFEWSRSQVRTETPGTTEYRTRYLLLWGKTSSSCSVLLQR